MFVPVSTFAQMSDDMQSYLDCSNTVQQAIMIRNNEQIQAAGKAQDQAQIKVLMSQVTKLTYAACEKLT